VTEDQGHPVEVTEEDREQPRVAEEEAEASVEEVPVDDLATLRQELEQARAREGEYLDGWQRARAELANARKRFQREQDRVYTTTKAGIFAHLLPIVDDFERAFETMPDDLSDLTWIEGIRLIQHKFETLLDQEGVEPVEALGQPFDPFLHEALTHEPSGTVPEGHVIGVLQKGYTLGDRVLRPSVVRVSSGPPPEPELEKGETPADEEKVVEGE
jgi:molecular chaperone GrpE